MTHIGLIAIIRGVAPTQARDVGLTLYAAGFRTIEVPLNSPDPFESIAILRDALPHDCRVGAGTVVTTADVDKAAEAGAELIVSPNTDPSVIARTVERGLGSFPGAATPTEAFAAIHAGARNIKLFPGSSIGVTGMQAWASVLPAETALIPVGGVSPDNVKAWISGGAHGLGIGASLYRPAMSLDEVAATASAFAAAWQNATS